MAMMVARQGQDTQDRDKRQMDSRSEWPRGQEHRFVLAAAQALCRCPKRTRAMTGNRKGKKTVRRRLA